MKHIEANNDSIYYRISGTENNRTIVLIHGLAGDSRFFHNQLKFFSKSFKVIAIDLPGHGRSPGYGGQSIEYYNDAIDIILDYEGIDRYILLGHSMGGCISIENYLKRRDRIEAVILVSTAWKLPVDSRMLEKSAGSFDLFLDELLSAIFNRKAGIFILAAQKKMSDHEKDIILKDLEICRNLDYEKALSEIKVPVLIIGNRFDRMIPIELTCELSAKITNSSLHILDDSGHVPFFENSSRFNEIVENFINTI